MFGFEHTIAKKYYGTVFESSLAHLAGGVCLSCCCPTRSNPRMFLGLSLRGAVRPPLLKELLGCTHRDAIGWSPPGQAGAAVRAVCGCQQTGGCCPTWGWLEKKCSVWAQNTLWCIPANTGKCVTWRLLFNLGKVSFDQNEIHINNLLF